MYNIPIERKENIVNRAQYDDIYVEWEENNVFLKFDNFEEEECYARLLNRLYH